MVKKIANVAKNPKFKKPLPFVVTALGGNLLSAVAIANYTVNKIVKPSRKPDPAVQTQKPDVPHQEVAFPTKNGRLLKGWYLRHPGEKRVVIVAHGYRSSKIKMLFTTFLWKAGFNVLLFDYRGYGAEREKGEILTLGHQELEDFQAAVDFVFEDFRRKKLGEPLVGAFGWSMGAAVTLVAAAGDERIKAVWADSSFSSRRKVIVHHWQKKSRLPEYPLFWLVDYFFNRRTGQALNDFNPLKAVASMSPRPLYFLHGKADGVTPFGHSVELYQAAAFPKQLWLEEGIGHVNLFAKHPQKYQQEVLAFFTAALNRAIEPPLSKSA
jgi:uncharacterized protein